MPSLILKHIGQCSLADKICIIGNEDRKNCYCAMGECV